MQKQLALHVWPGKWDLPTIDPLCLTAVFYLQATCPDNFVLVPCTNPDLSPNGQLPFLVYENLAVASLFSIVHFVNNLKISSPNSVLSGEKSCSSTEKAQKTAWTAHVQSSLGDFVLYSFYSVQSNWDSVTLPALCSNLSVPQRYYLPSRLREAVRTRLEVAGLWGLSREPQEKEKENPFGTKSEKKTESQVPKQSLVKAFELEKAMEQVRSSLELYANLLEQNEYFYHEPTMFDLLFAAHITLLLVPPFPDSTVKNLVEEFPTLLAHSQRVRSLLPPQTTTLATEQTPWWSAIPLLGSSSNRSEAQREELEKKKPEEISKDVNFNRKRWAWVTMAAGALIYIVSSSVTITIKNKSDPNDSEE